MDKKFSIKSNKIQLDTDNSGVLIGGTDISLDVKLQQSSTQNKDSSCENNVNECSSSQHDSTGVIKTTSKLQSHWRAVTLKLIDVFGSSELRNKLFKSIDLKGTDDTTLFLQLNIKMDPSWLKTTYGADILHYWQETYPKIKNLHIDAPHEGAPHEDASHEGAPHENAPHENGYGKNVRREKKFSANYKFDNFFVSQCNKLAYTACKLLCDSSNVSFFPLLLVGNSSTGKTHLLKAIGRQIERRNSRNKIVYLSAKTFSKAYISEVMTGQNSVVLNDMKNCDLLLMEDVNLLVGKVKTQLELLNIIDNLQARGIKVVFSSSISLSLLDGLDEGLTSRMLGGLVVDLNKPDNNLRHKVIRTKFLQHGIDIVSEVLDFLCSYLKTDIRKINGVLNNLILRASLNDSCNLDNLDQVRICVTQIFIKKNKVKSEKIMSTVAEFYGIELSDLRSKNRSAKVVQARQIAMYLIRKINGDTLSDIAAMFARHHASVIHSISQVNKFYGIKVSDLEFIKNLLT